MALLCSAAVSYAQTTTSSTDKSEPAKALGQGVKTPSPKIEQSTYHKLAEEVEDDNSMLFSKEALAIRRKNLTEPDATVKEGSGSSERNTKNHTGTTGNYRNLATQTSGVPSRE
ncbi:hypothetical protein SAMN05216327_11367 [Dyadobacter sp. SG02]|nr:hypothetical protein SAMN05216327_11367 [Dyadobacter sp. SG02]